MKCRYTKICRETYGINDNDNCSVEDAWECPIADKIEDILLDMKFIDRDSGEEVPFCEEYDGPVEEEEP